MTSVMLSIRSPQLVEQVASRLRERVLLDGVDGEKLPTEKAIAESFGVSRTVVREAVTTLKSEGLLHTKQGSGIFISRAGAQRQFRIVEGPPTGDGFRLVYELRFGIEVAAAELAATRRTDADILRLTQAIQAMNDPASRAAADIAFHSALAAATQNVHYVNFIAFLSDGLSRLLSNAVKNTQLRYPQQVSRVIAEHGRVLTAVKGRKRLEAREAMESHLRASSRRMSLNIFGLGDSRPRLKKTTSE